MPRPATAVTPDDARFFGTLQLQAEILPGVGMAVGIRNSADKSMPIGFCCGQSVFDAGFHRSSTPLPQRGGGTLGVIE